MGAYVDVDFDQLEALIDVLTGALTDLVATGETFDAEAQLVLAGWEGQAAFAFAGAHRTWQADNEISAGELVRAIGLAQRVLARYRESESTILELVT